MNKLPISTPEYKCHKVVKAAQIESFYKQPGDETHILVAYETPDGPCNATIITDYDWLSRHKPQTGGYIVEYEDGYLSYSPKKVFEEGYLRSDFIIDECESLEKAVKAHEEDFESGSPGVIRRIEDPMSLRMDEIERQVGLLSEAAYSPESRLSNLEDKIKHLLKSLNIGHIGGESSGTNMTKKELSHIDVLEIMVSGFEEMFRDLLDSHDNLNERFKVLIEVLERSGTVYEDGSLDSKFTMEYMKTGSNDPIKEVKNNGG